MMKKAAILITLGMILFAACAPQPTADETEQPSIASGPADVELTVEPDQEKPSKEDVLEELNATSAAIISSGLPEGASDKPLSEGLLLTIWGPTTGTLNVIDSVTGQRLKDRNSIPLGAASSRKLSPDGTMLAIAVYPSNSTGHGGKLHLIDLKTWMDEPTDIQFDDWAGAMAFSPDGKTLTLTFTDQNKSLIRMVDVSTKAVVKEASLDYWPMQMAYTPDGRSIALYGGHSDETNQVNPIPIIELRDARTLQPLWKQALTDIQDGRYLKPSEDANDYEAGTWMMPGVVFSHDGSKLYIVHAAEDKLTTVDLTARSVSSAAIQPPHTFLDWLVGLTAQRAYAKMLNGTEKQAYLSPDGTRLYVIGRTYKSTNTNGQIDMDVTSLGLQVIDPATGTELHRMDDIEANNLAISADGSRLYVYGWSDSMGGGTPWTKVYDTASFEEISSNDKLTISEAASLDGKVVLVSSSGGAYTSRIAFLDSKTYEPKVEWKINGWVEWGVP